MSAPCVFFVGGTRSGKSGMAQRWAEAVAPQRLYLATCRAEDEEMNRRVARHQAMRGSGWQCLEEPLELAGAFDRIFADVAQAGAMVTGVRGGLPVCVSADMPAEVVGKVPGLGLSGVQLGIKSEMQSGMLSEMEHGARPEQEAAQQSAPKPGVLLLDCISLWIANLLACDLGQEDILCKVSALGERLAAPPLPVAVVSAETGLGLVPMSPLARTFNDVLGLANQELARACRHVVFVSCGLPLPLKGGLPEELC